MVNPEYIVALIKKHGSIFWYIHDYTGKNCLAEQNLPGVTPEQSAEMFTDAISGIYGEYVNVKLRRVHSSETAAGGNVKSRGGDFNLQVKCLNKITTPGAQAPQINSGPTWVDLLALQKEINALQIEKIKIELNQVKTPALSDRLIEALATNPRLINGISGLVEKFAGISAPPPPRIEAPAPNLSETDFVDKFAAVLPDGYEPGQVLNALADYMKANPENVPAVLKIIMP